MEIKIGRKTIHSNAICKVMFVLTFIATVAHIIINMLSGSDIITGMVIFSACVTGLCYYLSNEKSNT